MAQERKGLVWLTVFGDTVRHGGETRLREHEAVVYTASRKQKEMSAGVWLVFSLFPGLVPSLCDGAAHSKR